VSDFLWSDERGLVGFLGIYGYRPDQVEICGMVHPAARRCGVFSRLLDAARVEIARRGTPEALLVVDRSYVSGAAFAQSVGGTIEHSEHRMTLLREPAGFVPDPLVSIRGARPGDGPFVLACIAEAFDMPAEAVEAEDLENLVAGVGGTMIIERAGESIGTVRVDRDGGAAGIYGFAVVAELRGRGIGRQVLSQLASDLTAEGLQRVSLEVSCSNDSALGLYLSCGFDVMGTEDYYAIPVAPVAP
jgi:ribosomal protein S18 acetylase RimI-like enzyme